MEPCKFCERIFKSPQGLAGHMRVHNEAPAVTRVTTEVAILEETLSLLSLDVQILDTEVRESSIVTQTQLDQHREVLASLNDQLNQVLASIQSLSEEEDSSTQIISKLNKLEEVLVRQNNQHPPGPCEAKSCTVNCHLRFLRVRDETVELINHRLPNVKAELRQIEEAMRTGDVGKLPMTALHLIEEVGNKHRGTQNADILKGMGF